MRRGVLREGDTEVEERKEIKKRRGERGENVGGIASIY